MPPGIRQKSSLVYRSAYFWRASTSGMKKKKPEISQTTLNPPCRYTVTLAMLLCEYSETRINDEIVPWTSTAVTGFRVRGLRWVKIRGRCRSRPQTKISCEDATWEVVIAANNVNAITTAATSSRPGKPDVP